MKKNTLISISVVLLILGLVGFWQYGSRADVKIVDMHASSFGAGDLGQLDIMLQNNGSKPVDVWLDIENAFVDENRMSYSTSRLIISNNSTSPWDEGSVSLQKPINLLPGNNSFRVWLGYKLPGEYPVKVRVVENSRLLDEETYPVNIPFPEIHLKLEYEMESKNTSDVYRIYGYLINKGLSAAMNVSTNLTVTNERTGELVLTSSELYDVGEKDKLPLWTWPDYPYAIVEIAHNKSSGKSYMPVQNVVIGSNEDRFKVNVTARWQNQVAFAELLIPPREETR
ncbi:MAG TPA: hypothetical protein VGK06_13060 [Methanosarcina sp.]|jgi:hypothetical protein